MLTVAQVVPEMHGGGVETGTVEVAAALVAAGHRSIVISAGGRLVETLESEGTQHVRMPVGRKSLSTLLQVRQLRRLLAENSVDVVHARSRVPAWVCLLALRRVPSHRRPAFLTTVHGLYSVNRFSEVMTRGDRVVCVSNTVRRYVLENYPRTAPERLLTIYRGVSPQRYPRGYRAEADWAAEFRTEFGLQDRPLIVLAGRLTRLKGHFDFLTLMQELGRRGSDVMGLIVGGEDPRRKQYAAELRAAVSDCPNVVMTGHRSDLREVMSLGSVVLSLSTKPESFGRTVLEALSLGIPVAGYDHGGVGEVLSALFPEGRVAPGDHAALANTVERLLTSPCPTIAENTDFTLESMLQRTLDLYESVGQRP